MKNSLKQLISLCLLFFLSFWAIRPFFVTGFFPMHDDTQPARVFEMAQALSFGQFPVRWVGDLGYGFGYPLFNFYAPLPYYVGAFFNLVGFDALTAAKIMMVIGILAAGISMYFLVNTLFGKTAGLVAAILYLYAPYHAVNIYVRGAVGELYAFAFLPLIALGIFKIVKANGNQKQVKCGILIASTGFAIVLLSHNILGLITGLLFSVILLVYLIYSLIKKQKLATCYFLLATVLIGFGLSAFFTLPALAEKKFTRVEGLTAGGSDFHQHFVYPDQLWNSSWGYGGSAPGKEDGMSFKIGKLHLILGLLSIPLILYLYRTKRPKKYLCLPAQAGSLFYVLCFMFIISVFMMLETSKSVWESIPILSYIQYPWRFLNITIFSLAVLSGFIFILLKKPLKIIIAGLIIVSVLLLNVKYFQPKEYLPLVSSDYTVKDILNYKISKISDEYLPPDFKIPQNREEIAREAIVGDDNLKIISRQENITDKQYQLEIIEPVTVNTNISYFPGWQTYLDGKGTEITSKDGRIAIDLPQGRHDLKITLQDTPIRKSANAISILSVFLLVYVSLFCKKMPLCPSKKA